MVKKTYPCTVTACDKVFLQAYELKKHLALHKDPNSVFFCPECDFITLQKKNLGIHFALHTGERAHHCPHMVAVDSGTERCAFKTNDPAALTKHRKRVHAYIPHRGRKVIPAPLSKWKALEHARRLLAPYKPPSSPSLRGPLSRSSSASDVGSSTACTSTSTDAVDDRTPQSTKENVDTGVDPVLSPDTRAIQCWLESTDVYGHPMQADASGDNPTRHPLPEDPGPSSSLDAFGDHALHIWEETDALMRSTSLASLDMSAPPAWARTDACPQSSSAGSLNVFGNDCSWEDTEALMRAASLDPLDASAPHPWAEPDLGMSSTTAGASANDRGALHPWAEPGTCIPSITSNVFGNPPTLHPWAETDVQKASTPAVTLDASGSDPTRLAWLGNPSAAQPPPGNADVHGFDPMYNAYILTRAASVAPRQGMDLNNIYDPTLCADWMAAYEYSYTHFDQTGVTHVMDPVEPPLVIPEARTGREGCLCPEWMTEAGIEGWDQSVVDAHREFYTF